MGETENVINTYLKKGNLGFEGLNMNRPGNGRIRFAGLKLINKNKEPIDAIRTGDSFSIELDYNIIDKSILEEPYVFFYIFLLNKRGGPLIQISNKFTKEKIPLTGKIICSIKNIPLAPDNYIVKIACKSNEVIEDIVDEALNLPVYGANEWGGYKVYPSTSGGNILVEQKWLSF